MCPRGHLSAHGVDQTRLAEPRFAREHDELTRAGARQPPAIEEESELPIAADETGLPIAMRRRKAALGLQPTQNAPHSRRLRKAFQLDASEVFQSEHPLHQASRGIRNDDAVRRRERLESGGKGRGRADHRLLTRRTLADQVSDHGEPGGDPEARLQADARPRLKRADDLDHLETRAHGALGRVLLRRRIPEIGDQAVAGIFGDKPAEPVDDLGTGIKVRVHDLAQLLGIEPVGQSRRIHHVAVQDGQVPSLRIASRRRARLRIRAAGAIPAVPLRRAAAQCPHRLEDLLAGPERKPERRQLGLGQIGQDLQVDFLSDENLPIAAEPEALQPRADRSRKRTSVHGPREAVVYH